MLALTDQVEASQKLGEDLKNQVATYQENELKQEEKTTKMLQEISEANDKIVELESLKSQADEEI